MATNADTVSMAAGMICKAAALAARWAGTKRKRALEQIAALPGEEKDKEILLLRELVKQLRDQLSFYQKQFGKGSKKPRYTITKGFSWFFKWSTSNCRAAG